MKTLDVNWHPLIGMVFLLAFVADSQRQGYAQGLSSTEGELGLSLQTGLFEQEITISNEGAAVAAFRVTATGLPDKVELYNRSGVSGGSPFIDYKESLEGGETVLLTVEFFDPNRSLRTPPDYTVTSIDATPAVGPVIDESNAVSASVRKYLPEGALVEFPSIAGERYVIQYTDDGGTRWTTAAMDVIGSGNRTLWLDNGPPKTPSIPDQNSNRSYRVSPAVEAPINPVVFGLFGEPYSTPFGDVDGDGAITLGDTQILSQHLSGLQAIITPEEAGGADMNLDGSINEEDLKHMATALFSGQSNPSRIDPEEGAPGKVVTIYSDSLQDTNAQIQITVNGVEAFEPAQAFSGRIEFIIPPDLTVLGTIAVELKVSGVSVEAFDFSLLPAIELSAEAYRQYVTNLIETTWQLRAEYLSEVDDLFDSGIASELDYTAEDALLIKTCLEEIFAIQQEHEMVMLATLSGLAPEVLLYSMRIALANMDREALPGQGFALRLNSGARSITASGISIICRLDTIAKGLDTGSDSATWVCAGLGLAAVVIAPATIGGSLVAAAAGCAAALAAAEIGSFILAFIPRIGNRLMAQVQPARPVLPGETAQITIFVELTGITELCVLAGSKGTGAIDDFIAKGLTKLILSKYPISVIYKKAKQIGKEQTKKFEDAVAGAIAAVVGGTGVSAPLKDAADRLCTKYNFLGSFLPVDPAAVQVTPSRDFGVLGTTSETITFQCPEAPPEEGDPPPQVDLMFALRTCSGNPLEAQTTIVCNEIRNVVITMGDNGRLLDDIFEVRLDGASFLTSGGPIRSTSRNIELTVGEHTLELVGRAAPDDVGTYFISVIGGNLLGGPPTSGENLSAGTVFRWILEVLPEP